MQVEYRRYDETSSSWTTEHTVIQPEFKDGRYYLGVILQGHRDAPESLVQVLQYSVYEVRYWILTVIDSLKMIARGQGLHKRYRRTCPHCHDHRSDCGREHPVRIRDGGDEPLNLWSCFRLTGRYESAPFPALDGGRLVFLLWELVTRQR